MIFYFSGCGNTKKLALKIAETISEKAVNVEDAIRDEQYKYKLEDSERLGFAFPIYFGDIPDVFVQFINKLEVETADHYYGYIVVTDGGMSEAGPNHLVHLLRQRALTINGVFGLRTIDTCHLYFKEWTQSFYDRMKPEIELNSAMIAEQIRDRVTGEHAQPSMFPRLFTLMMKPLYTLMRNTKGFTVSDKCTNCGLCAKNCPIHAIEIQNNKPVWVKDKCMICMRCLHHCPAEAIDFGSSTVGKGRYKTPI